MNEALESLAPWVIVFAYIGFGYIFYIWTANQPAEKQLISRSAVVGALVVGFVLVLVLIYLVFPDLQSRSGILSVL